jgi:hypothetical protein
MTPPAATVSAPQPHETCVDLTAKTPSATISAIDVTEQALANLKVDNKTTEVDDKTTEVDDKTTDEIAKDERISKLWDEIKKIGDSFNDKQSNNLPRPIRTLTVSNGLPVITSNGKVWTPRIPMLFGPQLITTDMDALRLEGAAYAALAFNGRDLAWRIPDSHFSSEYDEATSPHDPDELLWRVVSSPYNKILHTLDIEYERYLSKESKFFAVALTALKPAVEGYATAPYTQALNFEEVMGVLRWLMGAYGFQWKEISFYVVVFRSQLKEDIDEEYLYELDEMSHYEANQSGGLLKYWFGKKDSERRNLATCKLPFTSRTRKTTVD